MALHPFAASFRRFPRLSAGVMGLLCASLLVPGDLAMAAAPAGKAGKPGKPHVAAQPALTPPERALHVLNRLTFGPRPGELEQVERMGVEAWFQQQLHPERLPDDDLEQRLAQYPAMQLSQPDLVARFPTPQMLKRYSQGALLMPNGADERAIYADAGFRYEERREAKLTQKALEAGNGSTVTTASPTGRPAGVGDATLLRKPIVAPPASLAAPGLGAGAQVAAGTPESFDTAEREAILNLPPQQRMQRLLAMSPQQMAFFRETVHGPAQQRLLAGLTPAQVEEVVAMQTPERLVDAEVLSTRLLRDVYSTRQLQAVMTDFWLNHFSVYLRKNQNEPYLLPAYMREAILPHALGRFEDLLVATAESPAMLVYLDNWESIGPDSQAADRANLRPGKKGMGKAAPKGINENYARELMELHTLGVKGGYTQADVIEVAKCFTGWTIDRPVQGGQFMFNPNRHEPGPKTVLGHTIGENGMGEGLEVLHMLATSPATAHFISEKLAERFVSDTPPPALVDKMARTFLKKDGDIRAVLTTMFHAPEFWAPDVYRAKVKTPLEFMASALRATDADVTNPVPLVQAMDRLGMPVFGMQTPNGYSWNAEDWVSSNALLTRMNFALVLSGNRLDGTSLDWNTLLGGQVNPAEVPDAAAERKLEQTLVGQPVSETTRVAVLREAEVPHVQSDAEQSFRALPVSMGGFGAETAMLRKRAMPRPLLVGPETPLATAGGLLLGSPDFQRR